MTTWSPDHLPPPPPDRRALTTGGAVALAVAAAVGAVAARPMTLLIPGAIVVAAMAMRRPVLLGLAAMLAASALGARAVDGLASPVLGATVGEVTLVSDPVTRWGRVEAVARHEGMLVLLRADSPAAEVVAARLAGERMDVVGRLTPLGPRSDHLRVRHVAARLEVRTARAGAEAAPPWRAANHLRRLIADGTAPLGDDRGALFAGLVLGDDREHTPEMTDDFRGSGLAHLLAVSGQNVAFVLAVAAPVLRRLGLASRLAAIVVLLAAFATLTRFEPSVLRAVVMAAIAAVATARGRPTAGVHILALAVAGLILVDPFLVRSTGFRLSVAATAGILLLAPRLVAALPGPAPLVLPVAVSASAQIAVAPLIITTFGGLPVVSLPANLLAAPAAALAMTWGLPSGLVAGLIGSPIDGWLHAPTGLALGWLATVARTAASVPLGELRWPHVIVLVLAAVALVLAVRRPRAASAPVVGARRPRAASRVARVVSVGAMCGALAAPGVALRHPPVAARPSVGLTVWRTGGATVAVVAPGTGATSTLTGLRRGGVTQLDLLVLGPGGSVPDEERAARHRTRVRRVHHLGRDPDVIARLGGMTVTAEGTVVCIRVGGATRCSGGPLGAPPA